MASAEPLSLSSPISGPAIITPARLKGVVLSVCPDATLVDIGHDIPAHDVLAGALELAACYRYFPPGTIFLVVVDPGVGSARRGIAADIGDYRFVAPDNGVLSAVFRESPPKKVVELTERKYARPTVSRTFEGRDRFAPAAGLPREGHRAGVARQEHQGLSDDRSAAPVGVGRGAARRGRARRSLRQPDHEHRSPDVRAVRRRRRRSRSSSASTKFRASSRRMPKRRPVNCAHSSAVPITSRSRSMPATRRRRSGSRAAAAARVRLV